MYPVILSELKKEVRIRTTHRPHIATEPKLGGDFAAEAYARIVYGR
jgi:hypothetical protein